jgi:hypothetical protein
MLPGIPFEPQERDDAGLRALIACLAERRAKGKEIGSLSALSRELGLSKQGVAQWERIPWEYVLEIERLLGLKRQIQRPDIYPPPGKTRGKLVKFKARGRK